MNHTIKWKVVPLGLPTVIKHCSKCNNKTEFMSSRTFRVNANQNKLDVWLIYHCIHCNTTWNMEILSRVISSTIDKVLYHKFIQNDPELADEYAFDHTLHSKNKSVISYDNLQYDIIGENISLQSIKGTVPLVIECNYPFDIRIDKILSQKLGVSREVVKRMVKNKKITSDESKNIGKEKVKQSLNINLAL
ncbi:DUF1062 domain-containing protein [Mobilitalea sibirica]|uniref:DUF1062 domain-containing protein n=1 Tax=Mobilitalea sibirica TaxID=1462919 RepID=A0A8J7H678_9FIRM|nr:DUF1062 domain-containing protein [Mobilitalea sibirica]MBH1942239.1 DUF1062 domain-containing protein [Mobilitalea sibirica]